MTLSIPLPPGIRKHISKNSHLGLALDKYPASWNRDLARSGKLSEEVQHPTLREVAKLSQRKPAFDFKILNQRWQRMLVQSGAEIRTGENTTPLTLHLARASALENAGICLHPIYGFVYLPGTGLKGLARSYATTIWAKAQSEKEQAQQKISAVFGTEVDQTEKTCGNIVFYDAWPEQWPRLEVDILNSHHPNYYQKQSEPPGDWEDPIPVYFLVVPPKHSWQFPLKKRRSDVADELLELAWQWLIGGLEDLAAGAKTNSGYGVFRVAQRPKAAPISLQQAAQAEMTCELELVSPAFFAGAEQYGSEAPAGCTLRGATLRGQLRWWWRTLHANHLDLASLKSLEALLWGDTSLGGAIRLVVEPIGEYQPLPFDRKQVISQNRLLAPPNKKTSQGLIYHSYGTDEKSGRRHFLPPGSRWSLRLIAKAACFPRKKLETPPATPDLEPEEVLLQAQAALWLLCKFGGVGAKSRKGFGSLALHNPKPSLPEFTVDQWQKMVQVSRKPQLRSGTTASPSLHDRLEETFATSWRNVWFVLDQVASAMQAWAQQHKHQREKQALGLPRTIGRPQRGNFRPGKRVNGRHTSPATFHLTAAEEGTYTVVVSAFPSDELPNRKQSREYLQKWLTEFSANLKQRLEAREEQPQAWYPGASINAPAAATQTSSLPQPKDQVQARLLEERTKKGGWRAEHIGSGLVGHIVNSSEVPGGEPGQELTLIVASVTPEQKQITFRYPTQKDQASKRSDKKGSKPGNKHKGQKRR